MTAAIQFKNGKILMVNGKIAMDTACCCTDLCDGCENREWSVDFGAGGWTNDNPTAECGEKCTTVSGTFVVTNDPINPCQWKFESEDSCVYVKIYWDSSDSRLHCEVGCGIDAQIAEYQSAVYDHCSDVPATVELTKTSDSGWLCGGALPDTIYATKEF